MNESGRAGKAILPLILASGTMAIIGALMPDSAIWVHYFFKPLTTVLILASAMRALKPVSRQYRRFVLAGISLSLCGDVFLMLPASVLPAGFLLGLASFLCAHLFFLRALTSDARLFHKAFVFPVFIAIGAANLAILWPNLAQGLKLPVAGYVLCLLAMCSQAVSRHLELSLRSSRLAAFGGVFFLISDTILAYNKFYVSIPLAPFFILITYYTALYLIARSVAADEEPT